MEFEEFYTLVSRMFNSDIERYDVTERQIRNLYDINYSRKFESKQSVRECAADFFLGINVGVVNSMVKTR